MLCDIVRSHSFLVHYIPIGANSSPKQVICFQAEQLPNNPPSRHIKSSRSLYFFLDFELQQGKSKEFINLGMKVQVRRSFKSFLYLSPKKQ